MILFSIRDFPVRRLGCAVLLALPLLSGCRDAKVENYRVAKEPDAPPPTLSASADMAGTAVPGADGPTLTWTAPAHWSAKPAGGMRKATYLATRPDGTTAELSVTAFPGDVGGDLANVNRWRGQLALAAVTAEQLPPLLTHLDLASGLTATLVDLAGPAAEKPSRMLGAIVPFNGATWFFKLTGADATVTAEKPSFLAFIQSIQAPAATAAAPVAAPSAMASTAVPGADGPALVWTAPADWAVKPASAMRKATYLLPVSGSDPTELAITAFPGDVGGDLANVNRWRGQLGLPALDASELTANVTPLKTRSGLAVTLVDFANPSAATPTRMLGAIVPFNGATWFFKLTGPDAAVAAQKPAFLAFLQSIQAPSVTAVAPSATPNAMASTSVPRADSPALLWTAPTDWQTKPVSAGHKVDYLTAALKATYLLPIPGGGTSTLAITVSRGKTAGHLNNANNWSSLRGLVHPDSTESFISLTHHKTRGGLALTLVTVSKSAATTPSRIPGVIVAFVPVNGATWFFRLTGPDAAVAVQKPAFLAFLDTVTAP